MNRSTLVVAGLVLASCVGTAPALAAPPAPTVTAPTGDIAAATPTLQGTAGDAPGDSDFVVVSLTPSGGSPTVFDTARTGAAWSRPLTTALADGRYSVAVSQGNGGEIGTSPAHAFRVDTQAPVVTLNEIVAVTGDNTPTLTGARGVADGTGEPSADGGVEVAVYAGNTITGTPIRQLTATPQLSDFTATPEALADGTYTAVARQSDAAGNQGASATRTFTVDATGPVVTLAPVADTNVTKPIFKGTAEPSGSIRVVIRAGDTTVDSVDGGITHEDSWEAPVVRLLAPGTYTAEATQTDSAGNVGRSAPRTFTIDTTPPVVTLAAVADTGDTTPTFTGRLGRLARDSGKVTVVVHAGAGVGGPVVDRVDGGITHEDSWEAPVVRALAPGTYTAEATQDDAVGNHGVSGPRTFTIDAPLTVTLRRAAKKAARRALRNGRVGVGVVVTPRGTRARLTGRLLLRQKGGLALIALVNANAKPKPKAKPTRFHWDLATGTVARLVALGHFTLVAEVTATAGKKKPVKVKIQLHYDLKSSAKA